MIREVAIALACAAIGCADEAVPAPALAPRSFAGTLDVEIRGKAAVRIDRGDGDAATVSLAITGVELAGLFDASSPLAGPGRIERLPEADATLYSAKLALPPSPSGACGAQPIAAALALHRAGSNARVGGALTIYCGDQFYGVPARVIRLTGELPPAP